MSEKPVKASNKPLNLFAPVYDLGFYLFAYFAGGERRIRGALFELAEPLAGKKVLEVFAGTATLSIMAGNAGARVIAVDSALGMLGVAKEKVRKTGTAVDLIQADAKSLPLGTEVFDTVILSLGLHELCAGDLEPVLLEANRVLKKDGRLLIFDFHKAGKGGGFYQSLYFTFAGPDTVWNWLDTDIQTLLRTTGFGAFNRTFAARNTLQYISVQKR